MLVIKIAERKKKSLNVDYYIFPLHRLAINSIDFFFRHWRVLVPAATVLYVTYSSGESERERERERERGERREMMGGNKNKQSVMGHLLLRSEFNPSNKNAIAEWKTK